MTNIYAHRGASKYAPENTLPAFELAYEMKADGIETDVQLTKDEIPILIHDENVKRTTNGIGFVKDFTFAEIQELDAGSWFSKKYTGTPIMSLEEFLNWIKFKPLYLNIELKNNKIDYEYIESIVFEMVQEHQLLDRTTISTFNSESIKRMREINQMVEVAYLTSKQNNKLVTYAKDLGANAIHVNYRLLNDRLMNECLRNDMKIRVYTINRYPSMKQCFHLGCNGIFTDVPDKALSYRIKTLGG
ncbi:MULTISPECIES: glycerophosphodiester phosphodiesterase [Bacillaceae]|uniref:Glycerophosphodiester phosphodiesterase n=1 Tax=Oceanobacillus caeni TaxID=405946 RepID=A0ABR5MKJ8_9BACI|nr:MULTISPECIES: glycerophosphodiester phosphodiesterase [Bacillaceae]KKE80690.1 glycerophosphodiester phosphodiesterase [Bacilli bacterium VT-13-104]PZD84713.1 glycerophosphodiester phosphodiesterase [Bacilli bacterium]KPH76378.1 glycerophosphodiester phosphodiesterase [Oceanobacillus caeni]MBU8789789.1 glycerophosphodiester phosphodiesterase [Oceanobacillus caeni]MED4474430.1 glycerophosphodiester phosphodiesterase [Oceanobacillus caeni]